MPPSGCPEHSGPPEVLYMASVGLPQIIARLVSRVLESRPADPHGVVEAMRSALSMGTLQCPAAKGAEPSQSAAPAARGRGCGAAPPPTQRAAATQTAAAAPLQSSAGVQTEPEPQGPAGAGAEARRCSAAVQTPTARLYATEVQTAEPLASPQRASAGVQTDPLGQRTTDSTHNSASGYGSPTTPGLLQHLGPGATPVESLSGSPNVSEGRRQGRVSFAQTESVCGKEMTTPVGVRMSNSQDLPLSSSGLPGAVSVVPSTQSAAAGACSSGLSGALHTITWSAQEVMLEGTPQVDGSGSCSWEGMVDSQQALPLRGKDTRREQWPVRCLNALPEENRQRLWQAVGDCAMSLCQHLASTQGRAASTRDAVRQWIQLLHRRLTQKSSKLEPAVEERFGAGMQEAEEVADGIPPQVEFYDSRAPDPDVWQVISDLCKWSDLYGDLWDGDTIDDVFADARIMTDLHARGLPDKHVAPIFLYTVELHSRVLWVYWQVPRHEAPGSWQPVAPDTLEHDLQEGRQQSGEGHTHFRPSVASCRLLGSNSRERFQPHRASDPALGISVWTAAGGGGGGTWLVRYVNQHRGQDISPFHDTGLWLAQPEEAFAEDGRFRVAALPPSGVLEYLLARENGEHLQRDRWSATPLVNKGIRRLVSLCEAKTNQQKFDAELASIANAMMTSGDDELVTPHRDEITESGVFSSCPLSPMRSTELQQLTASVLGGRPSGFDEPPPATWAQKRSAAASLLLASFGTEAPMADEARAVEMARIVFQKKTPVNDGATRPTPLELAHALTQQVITYDGRQYVAALSASSGEPRVLGVMEARGACAVQQLNHALPHQPFWHLNGAMRALQFAREAPSISAQGRPATEGSYVAQEGSWEQRDADQVIFAHSAGAATMRLDADGQWRWSQGRANTTVPRSKVTVQLNTWLLPLVRPLMQLVDSALSGVAECKPDAPSAQPAAGTRLVGLIGGRRRSTVVTHFGNAATGQLDHIPQADAARADVKPLKNYRGICGVRLPRTAYAEGNIVRWGAYTSASEDQGIASSFALGEGDAAVFTIQGRTCSQIAPWSRFARERECIYRPNTLFHIMHCLTAEQQQILGKEGLQLYELREIAEQEASCIMVHRLLRRVRSRGAANVIFQVVEAIRQDGVLDVSLSSPNDGCVDPSWWYLVRVPEGQEKGPVAASTDWELVDDTVAAARLMAEVEGITPVPRRIDITVPPRYGTDTSRLDPYRRVFHCGHSDHVLEARLQMFGDVRGGGGLRSIPATGGSAGWQVIHDAGSILGSVRWVPDDRALHTWSSQWNPPAAGPRRGSRASAGTGHSAPTEVEDARGAPLLGRTPTDAGVEPPLRECTIDSLSLGDTFAKPACLRSATHSTFASQHTMSTADTAPSGPGPAQRRKRPGNKPSDLRLDLTVQAQPGHIESEGGWRPDDHDPQPWYQLETRRTTLIGGLTLKGVAGQHRWVTAFCVRYSPDGEHWEDLQGGRVFDGCTSNDEMRFAFFHPPVVGRAVRIYPQVPDRWWTVPGAVPPGLRAALLVEHWSHERPTEAFVYGPHEQDVDLGTISRVLIHLRGAHADASPMHSSPHQESKNPRGKSANDFYAPQSASRQRGVVLQVAEAGRVRTSWALSLELRFRSGRRGMAIGLEGAATLARVLQLGVPLRQVAARNNQIGCLGLALILEALRQNRHVTAADVDDVGVASSPNDQESTASSTPSGLLASPCCGPVPPAPSAAQRQTAKADPPTRPPLRKNASSVNSLVYVPDSPAPSIYSPGLQKTPPLSGVMQRAGSARFAVPGWERPRSWALLRSLAGPGNVRQWGALKAALAVRCMNNRGPLNAAQLLAVDKWPRAVVLALWDDRSLLSKLPLRTLVQAQPHQLEVLLLGLVEECAARRVPPPHLLLHTACTYGQLSLVSQLLRCGINPDEADSQGRCALHCAVRHANFDDPDDTSQGAAAARILKRLATPTALAAADNTTGRGALTVAVHFHRMNIVRRLLQLGTDSEAADFSGMPALGWAESMGYSDMAALLRSFGAKELYHERGDLSGGLAISAKEGSVSEDLHIDHVAARAAHFFLRRQVLVARLAEAESAAAFVKDRVHETSIAALQQQIRLAGCLGHLWLCAAHRRRERHRQFVPGSPRRPPSFRRKVLVHDA